MVVFLPRFHRGTITGIHLTEATLVPLRLVMVWVLIPESGVREWIHTAAHWHLRIVGASSHALALSLMLLRHASLKLIGLIGTRLLLHIRENRIQPAYNIVWFRLDNCGGWHLLLLLLLLLHLHLLILLELLLDAHLHSLLLLLLHHGRVHHLLGHHVWLHGLLLLRWHHIWLRLSGHERILLHGWQTRRRLHNGWLGLSWLLVAVATHQVKEVDICCGRVLRRWHSSATVLSLCWFSTLTGIAGLLYGLFSIFSVHIA